MIKGSLVAIVTPMLDDGRIDLARFKSLIDFHVAEGTDGIVVVGTTGESPTVNFDEHKDLIRKAVEFASGRVPIVAGTGANSTAEAIEHAVLGADLVIGAVLVPGAAAPKLVSRDMVRRMRPGSVLVDIAIDQGGCFETSRPTTHADPTYVAEGVVHYCVTNMPGAVARTSTQALTNATLPFVLALADKGWKKALGDDPHLANGLNIHNGQVTHPAVAQAFGMHHMSVREVLVGGPGGVAGGMSGGGG